MLGWDFALCPQAPVWAVDWDAIEERYAWIRALADVPQEPCYHAEGDVLIHTRMAAEALAGFDEWRALDSGARAVLFLAALLHDVAKPDCTLVEPDGRITAYGHARRGATKVRTLLYTGEGFDAPAPLLVRETVAALVRHHGLPLWLLEKDDPARAEIAASQTVRQDWLALVAEADVRGRRCADQGELLDRIALFRAHCEELECYRQPRAFPTAHSRFAYFHGSRDPDYQAYDDTVCEVMLLAGLPGAGKDTWIRQHVPGLPVISLDALRQELGVAPSDDQGAVAHTAKARARELLRARTSFVWNATNVTRALRAPLIELFVAYHARVHIVCVDAPYQTLLRRNASRARPVPPRVIAMLLHKLEVPDATEAEHVTWVYDDEDGGTVSRDLPIGL
jgi:predicted kinase